MAGAECPLARIPHQTPARACRRYAAEILLTGGEKSAVEIETKTTRAENIAVRVGRRRVLRRSGFEPHDIRRKPIAVNRCVGRRVVNRINDAVTSGCRLNVRRIQRANRVGRRSDLLARSESCIS